MFTVTCLSPSDDPRFRFFVVIKEESCRAIISAHWCYWHGDFCFIKSQIASFLLSFTLFDKQHPCPGICLIFNGKPTHSKREAYFICFPLMIYYFCIANDNTHLSSRRFRFKMVLEPWVDGMLNILIPVVIAVKYSCTH